MGEYRRVNVSEPLDRTNLCIGHSRGPVPSFAKNSGHPSGFQNLDAAAFIHGVAYEEITREHRGLNHMPGTPTPRPDFDLWQERVESLCDQLFVDE
jgi:hypothetical protein